MYACGIHIIFASTVTQTEKKRTNDGDGNSHILNLHRFQCPGHVYSVGIYFVGLYLFSGFYIICTDNYTYFNQRENSRHLSTLTQNVTKKNANG